MQAYLLMPYVQRSVAASSPAASAAMVYDSILHTQHCIVFSLLSHLPASRILAIAKQHAFSCCQQDLAFSFSIVGNGTALNHIAENDVLNWSTGGGNSCSGGTARGFFILCSCRRILCCIGIRLPSVSRKPESSLEFR